MFDESYGSNKQSYINQKNKRELVLVQDSKQLF